MRASEERLQFWRQLKDVAQAPTDEAAVAERVRAELMQRISASLGLGGGAVTAAAPARRAPPAAPASPPAAENAAPPQLTSPAG